MGANIGGRQSRAGVCSGWCKKRRQKDKEKLTEKPNRLARIRKDKELIRRERERESKRAGETREEGEEGGAENAGDAKEVEGPSVKPTEVAGGFSPGIKKTR